MNKIGKQNIIEAFEAKFKKGYDTWPPFKNKYDTSRKRYTKFKKLLQNRTGPGFDDMGRIDMSDDWWNEREKVCFAYLSSVYFFRHDLFKFPCLYLLLI